MAMNENDAFHIIQLIADGKDPYTYGQESSNSPENNPLTVRALCIALSVLISNKQIPDSQEKKTRFDPLINGEMSLDDVTRSFERDAILAALEQAGRNKTRAAEILGITYRSFRYKLEQYGIE
jgi:DNA-binding NtrC family response regulator